MSSTYHWSPGEASLARQSLNALVSHKKFDVPEAIMWQVSMGKKAEMGEGWLPSGVKARRRAEGMMDRPESTPVQRPGALSALPRRLDDNFMASRTSMPARPSEEVIMSSGGFLTWQQPLRRTVSLSTLQKRQS
eukprot:TRINITY_DN3933_c0_g1_i2.p1 TRINITY_DN3933_c0_g1~~TRINITY_DN3933_c0_g1_i2.p1  ORF type:complete len:134 (-),score=19.02 TRINITY_DN3933_c0_g1_i2:145-546(-)